MTYKALSEIVAERFRELAAEARGSTCLDHAKRHRASGGLHVRFWARVWMRRAEVWRREWLKLP
jgi:hypothetical protein